jgi:hypothetical protein
MCAVVGLTFAATGGASGTKLRSCGSAPKMASNHVWATRIVSCKQARRLMRDLLGGSNACYPIGPTDDPRCVLEGFHCSARESSHIIEGNCVNHRKRIRGRAED